MHARFSAVFQREFQQRADNAARALQRAGVAQYVVTDSENIFYLTGATFEALERPFFLILDSQGSRTLIVPMLELDHLGKAWGISEDNALSYREFPAPAGCGWQDVLLGGTRLKSGFAFDSSTPHAVASALISAGGEAMDLIGPLRLIKSPLEIELVERAARYADWGVEQILRNVYAGALAVMSFVPTQHLQRKIIRETPDWDALATKIICGAWPAPLSAEPHSIPRLDMTLGAGPHVAMVLTRVNGYAAESERTFFTVPPTSAERERFALMEQARRIAFDMVRPGVECAAIDEAVNAFLDCAGFADFRTRLHRCGHGFGLGNHEPPWIATGSTHVLQENMLISIEPGLYEHGKGGYRHSDTVLVTADGYRCLTQAPCTLERLTLPRPRIAQRAKGWVVAKTMALQ